MFVDFNQPKLSDSFFPKYRMPNPYKFSIFLLLSLLFSSVLCSNVYSQSNRFTVDAASISPNQSNHYAQITAILHIRNPNASIVAGQDSIKVEFPVDFLLPSSVSASAISVGGLTVTGGVYIGVNSITFKTPISAGNGNTQEVKFLPSAKIKNPATPGNYTISVTIKNTYSGTSPNVTIVASNTTVSAAAVTPDPSVEFFPSKYTVSFRLGEGGYLAQDNTIFLNFPVGTTIPNGFLSGVTINGTNALALKNGNSIELTTPRSYDNNQFIQVIIPKASGMRNPEDSINPGYTIGVRTSSESTTIQSDIYRINPVENLSFSSVLVSPDSVNKTASYEVKFYTGIPGNLVENEDFIDLTFPANATLPNNINLQRITISNSDGFTTNPTQVIRVSDQQIKIKTPLAIESGTEVNVRFQSTLGLINPSEPGNYVMQAKTIRPNNTIINDETPSNPFAIFSSNTLIEQPLVSLLSLNENQSTTYTITFKVGASGGLAAGLNSIHLTFPTNTGLSTNNAITVNGTTVPNGNKSISGTRLSFVLPAGVSIPNNGQVTFMDYLEQVRLKMGTTITFVFDFLKA